MSELCGEQRVVEMKVHRGIRGSRVAERVVDEYCSGRPTIFDRGGGGGRVVLNELVLES